MGPAQQIIFSVERGVPADPAAGTFHFGEALGVDAEQRGLLEWTVTIRRGGRAAGVRVRTTSTTWCG